MLHPDEIEMHVKGIFPATPHPDQKFVSKMIKWAKKKDMRGDTIRRNFCRRPEEATYALGFAWIRRRPSLKKCPRGWVEML